MYLEMLLVIVLPVCRVTVVVAVVPGLRLHQGGGAVTVGL